MESINVLFVDDDKDDFFIVNKYLSKIDRVNFILDRAESYEIALVKILENKHDVYLIDYCLGIKNGLDLLEEVMQNGCEKPIIFITGQKNNNIDIKAMELGATDYLIKDKIDPQIIERSIRYSIERKKLEKKIRQERSEKDMIVDITVAGMCLTNALTDDFIEVNTSFLKMFDMERDEVLSSKFHDVLNIKKYSQSLYSNDFDGNHVCIPENCPCVNGPIECRVFASNGVSKDCLLSCKSIEQINGSKKRLRVVTMIDTTRQKDVERKLIETTIDLQEKIKEFGIKNENPKAIISLINTEVDKINNIEEIAEKWGS